MTIERAGLTVWATYESMSRLRTQGGNCKGAIPVHGKPSATATIPLHDQAMLDASVMAAVIVERFACAATLEAAADLLVPPGTKRAPAADRHTADVLRRQAAAIRARV